MGSMEAIGMDSHLANALHSWLVFLMPPVGVLIFLISFRRMKRRDAR